jgi:general secretion pathway protein K
VRRERGAAVLLAMLVVAMVATVSAAALWKQWRTVEVEAAERARAQSFWILTGALDWARLILREDARSDSVDHLAELWAVPLQESRLTVFLSAERALGDPATTDTGHAFLSGEITDLQSRLNVSNLAAVGRISEPARHGFTRLFGVLGLPQQELFRMTENLKRASDIDPDNVLAGTAPLLPQRTEHLVSMGLSLATLAVLEPHIAVLPGRTPVNLNTASAEVIYSAIDGIDMADARRLVAGRRATPLRSIDDAARLLAGTRNLHPGHFSVASRFFEVRSRLRLGPMVVEDRALVQRDGLEVAVLQRGRGVVDSTALALAASAPRR